MRSEEFVVEGLRHNVAAATMLGLGALSNPTSNLQPAEVMPIQFNQTVGKILPPVTPVVSKEVKKEVVSKEAIAAAKALLEHPSGKMLYNEAIKAGITGTELAQFMAQCAHESADFRSLKEYGTKSYFMHKYDKQFSPQTAADLGNTKNGDGAKYFGRGYIQLSGRENYTKAGKALRLDIVNHPELVEQPEIATKTTIWFWQNRVIKRSTDFSNIAAMTKPINKGLRDLDKRHAKFLGFDYVINDKSNVKEQINKRS